MLAYIPYMDPVVYIYIYELISSHTYHLGTKECSDDLKYQVVGSPQISAAPTTTFGAMCPRWRMHSCLPNGYKAGDWLSYRIRLTTSRTVGRRFARCEICPGSSMHSSVAMASMRRLDLSQSSRSRKSGIRGKQGATFTTGPFILTSPNDFESWSD